MRVLLATDTLPTPPRGGLDLHVSELIDALPALGVTIQVVPLTSFHLAQALRESTPDIVHFHSLQGLSPKLPQIAKRHGSAVVWTLHDFLALCPRTHLHDALRRPCAGPRGGLACGPCFGGIRRLIGPPVYTRRYRAMRASLEACDRLIAPSKFVRDVFVSEGLDAESFSVIAPAVRAPDSAARAPSPGGRPRFVYAGDLRRSKGIGLLVRSMNELQRECELVVHGGAPAHPAPRERDLEEELRAGSKGRAIRYQGRYAPETLPSLLDGALALVVPSLVRESFGRTANEALLCGVPVIVPDEGGLAEQVEPGVNGLLFEAGNARSLAQAMKKMVREGEAMSSRDWKTGEATWPEAPHFDGELQRLVALYGACL